MTTWTEITNAQTDQDSPLTQTLVQALRDNVNAAAEGATGAPANIAGWHPYDMVDNDDGADGKVYDYSVDGSTTGLEITLSAGFEYLVFITDLSHGDGTSRNLLLDGYRAVAASYTNIYTSSSTGSSGANANGWFELRHPRYPISRQVALDGIMDFSAVDNGRYYATVGGSEYVTKLRIRFSNDVAWDSGSVYLYRRQFLI